MGETARRVPFRLRLLLSVAALSLAVPVPGKAWAQAAGKWQPDVELGGQVGTDHSFGDVDILLPVWQDQTSLLFGDLRGNFSSQPTQEGQFGIGYRTLIDPDWILGGWAFFDIQNNQNGVLSYQGSVGAELLSVDWDFRVNGYFPFNGTGGNGNGNVTISGNTIESQDTERLFGFDGEIGWRVPIFPADGDMDLRVFAGGFFFDNSNANVVAGPRGRVELRLYDLDILGLQSRLTINGEIEWDEVRSTQAFGGLELRIPLGGVFGDQATKLSPLDRRMVDRIQRDVDIVSENLPGGGRNVIVDGLTVKTHTIVFANATGGPADKGTRKDPTDLSDAVKKFPGRHAIIVVEGNAGTVPVANPLILKDGEALLGGGSTVQLTVAHSGRKIDFLAPGSRPTLSGIGASTANLIDMASGGQNRVTGLDLTGSFYTGVFGHEVMRAVVTDNTIKSAAGTGIFVRESGGTVPADVFIDIERNTIAAASTTPPVFQPGHQPGDGVAVFTYLSDGAVHSEAITIAGNNIDHPRYVGIFLGAPITSVGTALHQTIVIAGNTLTHTPARGIYVNQFVKYGAAITQTVAISDNLLRFDGTGRFGDHVISVQAWADKSGTLTQTLNIDANTVTANKLTHYGLGAGIYVDNRAGYGGRAVQTATLANNIVQSTTSGDGIVIMNTVFGSGTARQTVAFVDDVVGYGDSNGIRLVNAGNNARQTVTLQNSILDQNASNGLRLANDGTRATQTVTLLSASGNFVNANGSFGAYLSNGGGAAAANQVLNINGNDLTGNGAGATHNNGGTINP